MSFADSYRRLGFVDHPAGDAPLIADVARLCYKCLMSDTPRFSSFSTGHHMSSQLSGWALPSEPEMLNRPYKPPVVASTFEVEGEVLEVLEKLGLAHIKTGSGEVYGINLKTPGIIFSDLHEGQKVRCTVTHKFHRVLSAALLV